VDRPNGSSHQVAGCENTLTGGTSPPVLRLRRHQLEPRVMTLAVTADDIRLLWIESFALAAFGMPRAIPMTSTARTTMTMMRMTTRSHQWCASPTTKTRPSLPILRAASPPRRKFTLATLQGSAVEANRNCPIRFHARGLFEAAQCKVNVCSYAKIPGADGNRPALDEFAHRGVGDALIRSKR
jgi:hypothetical protein